MKFSVLVRCMLILAGTVVSHPAVSGLYEQRQLYLAALDDLNHGRKAGLGSTVAALEDYPLRPYLEYAVLLHDLRAVNAGEVQDFRRRWAGSPLPERLRIAWLDDLARRGAWTTYLEHYEPTPDAERRCYYLRAMYRSGEKEKALEQVAEVWRAPRSLPKACDPLFDTWIGAGYLTQGLVWDRLTLALNAHEDALARYLAGLLEGEMAEDAATFIEVSRRPALVANRQRLTADTERSRTIITHGIRRLATTDPVAAGGLWSKLSVTHAFADTEARRIGQDLTIGLARAGIIDPDADLTPTPDGNHVAVAEALLLAGIQSSAWDQVEHWVRSLDAGERAKPKWRYWLARALRALHSSEGGRHASDSPPDETVGAVAQDLVDPPTDEAGEIFYSLARERQYYGFLAAHAIGAAPVLNERSSQLDPELAAALRARPAMQRISELFAVGDGRNARREWQMLEASLDLELKAAAAHVAAEMGWVAQSVLVANAADLRNDLTLRFPAPFRETFRQNSHASTVPINFLYAIARQESVFAADARSPAGALGVMQLMPGTARMTARTLGAPVPGGADLFHPDVNIRLGSHHLAALLVRYGGHRALVAAAYNAGASRVDRWLEARPVTPVDVWIESIPFTETRNYVKNVLAFAYVYGQLLDHPAPFLMEQES